MGTDLNIPRSTRLSGTVLLVFLLVVVIGGANAVAIRFAVAELPPFWGAALRFGGGAVALWCYAVIRKIPLRNC